MLFDMTPLKDKHGIDTMEQITSLLLKLQNFKKQCDQFLYSADYYRSIIKRAQASSDSTVEKSKRKKVEQKIAEHQLMLKTVCELLQGTPESKIGEDGKVKTDLTTTSTPSMKKQVRIQFELIEAAETERDLVRHKQLDTTAWLIDLMIQQTTELSKYYRDKISFIQYDTVLEPPIERIIPCLKLHTQQLTA